MREDPKRKVARRYGSGLDSLDDPSTHSPWVSCSFPGPRYVMVCRCVDSRYGDEDETININGVEWGSAVPISHGKDERKWLVRVCVWGCVCCVRVRSVLKWRMTTSLHHGHHHHIKYNSVCDVMYRSIYCMHMRTRYDLWWMLWLSSSSFLISFLHTHTRIRILSYYILHPPSYSTVQYSTVL